MTAACAVGQDSENAPWTSATLRAASATTAAISTRSRPVVPRLVGAGAIYSVNDPRAHAASMQRQRGLCQRTGAPLSRSRYRAVW